MNITYIRDYCKDHNITIAEFERAASLSNGIVVKWESMAKSPRYDILKKAADYCGCTVDKLVNGKYLPKR